MSSSRAIFRQLIFSLVLIVFAACTAQYKKVVIDFEKADAHYKSYREFPYLELSEGKSWKGEINKGSDVFDFNGNKSFFKAFELPADTCSYRITVNSYIMGNNINKAFIFFPTVILLDKDFKVTRIVGKDNFYLTKLLLKETRGLPYKFEGTIKFTDMNKDEVYMIIYTTSEQRSMMTSVTTMKTMPVILPGAVGIVPVGRKETFVNHSPVGRLKIEVKGD